MFNQFRFPGYWNALNDAVLPVEYDGSLSLGQQIAHVKHLLGSLAEVVKEIQDFLKDYDVGVDDIRQMALSNKTNIEQLNVRIDQFQKNMKARIEDIMADLSAMDEDVTIAIRHALEAKDKAEGVDSKLNIHMSQAQLEFSKFRSKIFEIIEVLEDVLTFRIESVLGAKSGKLILVKNAVTGMITNLDDALHDLHMEILAAYGLKMKEFRELKLTNAGLKSFEITAAAFRAYAKLTLMPQIIYAALIPVLEELRFDLLRIDAKVDKRTAYFDPYAYEKRENDEIVRDVIYRTMLPFQFTRFKQASIKASELKSSETTKKEFLQYGFAKLFAHMMLIEQTGGTDKTLTVIGNWERIDAFFSAKGNLGSDFSVSWPDGFGLEYGDASSHVYGNLGSGDVVEYTYYDGYRTYMSRTKSGYFPNALSKHHITFIRR